MKRRSIALVAPASKSRLQLARYLRDAGYEVIECDEPAVANGFSGVVVVDDVSTGDAMRTRAKAWIRRPDPPRVVVISSRPARWKALALALVDHLIVLAAPSFGWEIVEALRVNPPELPGPA